MRIMCLSGISGHGADGLGSDNYQFLSHVFHSTGLDITISARLMQAILSGSCRGGWLYGVVEPRPRQMTGFVYNRPAMRIIDPLYSYQTIMCITEGDVYNTVIRPLMCIPDPLHR